MLRTDLAFCIPKNIQVLNPKTSIRNGFTPEEFDKKAFTPEEFHEISVYP